MARLPSKRLVKRSESQLADFVSEIRHELFEPDGPGNPSSAPGMGKKGRANEKDAKDGKLNFRDDASELLFAEDQITLAVQSGLIKAAIYVDEERHFPEIVARIAEHKKELDAVNAELRALPQVDDDEDLEENEEYDKIFYRSEALEDRKETDRDLNYPIRPGRYELSSSAWTELVTGDETAWTESKVSLTINDIEFSRCDIHPLWQDAEFKDIELKHAQIVILDPDAAVASIFSLSQLVPDISRHFERFRTNLIPELFAITWRYLYIERPEASHGLQAEITNHVLQYAQDKFAEAAPSESTVGRVVQAVLFQASRRDSSEDLLIGSIWGLPGSRD